MATTRVLIPFIHPLEGALPYENNELDMTSLSAKPWVKGIEKNKSGEFVVEGNFYAAMLQHLYITEKGLNGRVT